MSIKSIEPETKDVMRPRFCVLFPGALGDFICFLPALQVLGRAAVVDLFARSEFAGLAPDGIAVSSLDRSEVSGLFRTDGGEEARRFFRAYDAVYSWFASADREFVRRLQTIMMGRAQIFPFRPARAETHQADYYLRCLNQQADYSAEPMVALREEAVRWCEDFWTENALGQRPVLTVASGSGSREKNWPEEFFFSVVQWWRAMTGGVVLLLIGPVEQERGGIERLRSSCLVVSDLTLSQVAALLSRSRVYLGNDSGVSHLAAATGVRTVTLFGPSNSLAWAPRGRNVIVLGRNLDCSPCQEPTMKSCPHHACLTEFFPDEVIGILTRLPEVVTLTR